MKKLIITSEEELRELAEALMENFRQYLYYPDDPLPELTEGWVVGEVEKALDTFIRELKRDSLKLVC